MPPLKFTGLGSGLAYGFEVCAFECTTHIDLANTQPDGLS
jgi:hypothetical protein